MSELPSIANDALHRAEEIRRFLQKNVKVDLGEELICDVHFETDDGNGLHGMQTKTAALMIYAWIFTAPGSEESSRPIKGVVYPDTWQVREDSGRKETITVFDGYFLDETQTEAVRAYRPHEMIFPVDMLDRSSD